MFIEDVKARFAVNYYFWARQNLHDEIVNNFPILSRIPSCLPVIDFLQQLSDHQQLVAISAFAKRGHAEALKLIGEIATSEETLLLRKYLKFMDVATLQTSTYIQSNTQHNFDRAKFTEDVDAGAGIILGRLVEKGGQLFRRYSLESESAQIETMVHTGGRTPQLQYEHKLVVSGRLICEHISVLSWLGIIAGTTYWKPLDDETSKTVIETFKDVCSLFITAIPKLIDEEAEVDRR